MDITSEEIEELLVVEKIEKDGKDLIITCLGKQDFELKNDSNKMKFKLSTHFSEKINGKYTINLNYNNFNISRIDINGGRHRNPNYVTGISKLDKYRDSVIEGSHIHIFRVDKGESRNWAIPIEEVFDEEGSKQIKRVFDFFKKETNIKSNIIFYKKNKTIKVDLQKIF